MLSTKKQFSSFNIYNAKALVVDSISLPEEVVYLSGRTSKGSSGLYYKGVGVDYTGHSALDIDGYIGGRLSEVFYYGYDVVKEVWVGKSGVFQERMQPFFSDFIGTCGLKELKIINNSKEFELAAVKVVDYVEYDSVNNQCYFILDYGDDARSDWIKDGGITKDLLDLIKYMLTNDWNFPWDKGSIGDVSSYGKVHDVADMYKSNEFKHKLGTVYSLLYSMCKKSKSRYYDFVTTAGYIHTDDRDFILIAAAILNDLGIDVGCGFPARAKNKWDVYYHLIGNCLLEGRNCGYVENVKSGDIIKKQYLERFFNRLPTSKSVFIKSFKK